MFWGIALAPADDVEVEPALAGKQKNKKKNYNKTKSSNLIRREIFIINMYWYQKDDERWRLMLSPSLLSRFLGTSRIRRGF